MKRKTKNNGKKWEENLENLTVESKNSCEKLRNKNLKTQEHKNQIKYHLPSMFKIKISYLSLNTWLDNQFIKIPKPELVDYKELSTTH